MTGLAMLSILMAAFGVHAPAEAQPAMSDFNPDVELRRIGTMPASYQRVQRYYYLGDLTSCSGRSDAARQAYRQAMLTFGSLRGDHRALATTYAAHAAVGLGALTHVEFRETPLRWEHYAADSARRWQLLVQAREEYGRVATVGYARATFEALLLRAHLLEEWDDLGLDTLAEKAGGTDALARCIRHLDLAAQLMDQAGREYARIVALEDSLGLVGGSGDRDVSEWTGAARERLAALGPQRERLAGVEEALQALYAERRAAVWVEQATPLLWERVDELTRRDAGLVDPFFDYVIATKLADDAFRPFVYGATGFLTVHRQSLERARAVRPQSWVDRRLQWERQQDWLDTDISRRLARRGLDEMRRAPAVLDTLIGRLDVAADSLPSQWQATLGGPPPVPDVRMPPIPRLARPEAAPPSYLEREQILDEYERYQAQMRESEAQIAAYRDAVSTFGDLAGRLASGTDVPPEVERYMRLRRALSAAQIVLLDTLARRVLDQVYRALDESRRAAVWLPPGLQSSGAQQAIEDYVVVATGKLRAISEFARSEAERRRREAGRPRRRPPVPEELAVADALIAFAGRIDRAAAGLRAASAGS